MAAVQSQEQHKMETSYEFAEGQVELRGRKAPALSTRKE